MDVAIVLKVLDTCLKLAESPTVKKISSSWSYKSELAKMEGTMKTINMVLRDAEQQERNWMLHMDREWFELLRDAVNEANVLFDEVATKGYRKQLKPGGKRLKEVCLFFSRFNQLDFAFTMSHEVRKLRKRLNEIASNRRDFASSSQSCLGNIVVPKRRKDSHSLVLGKVFGRDKDKNAVSNLLFSSISKDFYFISIFGIGGLGKTTLAQLIYNDTEINSNFSLRLWVCVSDDFDIETILRKLLQSYKPENYDHLGMETLCNSVEEHILSKKFLLVLDDVWNENVYELVSLRNLLMKGEKGSRIIVTTRSEKVAKNVGDETYELGYLSDKDSWNLFEEWAFRDENRENMELVRIGGEILIKCAKLPLVIAVVGSLLRDADERKWISFRDRDLDLEMIKCGDQSESVLNVLKRSYDNLSAPLKRCFSFCAIFPKDYRIHKNTLISMWMAHDFIEPEDNYRDVEDVGEDYFMTLLQRCFFYDVEIDRLGKIESCKIHDLMHDVARGVAENDILLVNSNNVTHLSQLKINARHLSLGNIDTQSFTASLGQMKHLHTIFLSGKMKGAFNLSLETVKVLLSKASYLRALSLCHMSITDLPSTINKLYHLRHLDLSNDRLLLYLPEAVCSLMNLQTLQVKNCTMLTELPKGLSKLLHLRELDILGCNRLTHMPMGMNNLTCLQRLSMFVAKFNSSGSSFVGKLQDLEALTNVRGSLEIRVVGDRCIVASGSKYVKGLKANFNPTGSSFGGKLQDLDVHTNVRGSLGNHIDGDGCNIALGSKYVMGLKNLNELSVFAGTELLLEGLQPHRNIKSFQLLQYYHKTFPKWESSSDLEKSLPNLVKFSLTHCHRLQHIPLLGRLRYLKVLKLQNLANLKYIEDSEEGMDEQSEFFPVLETLRLINLTNMKTWHRDSTPEMIHPVSHRFSYLSSMSINGTSITSIPLSAKLKILELICQCSSSLSRIKTAFRIQCELWRPDTLQLKVDISWALDSLSEVIVGDLFWSRLSTLDRLEIRDWVHLKSLTGAGFQHLTSLRDLKLIDLPKLTHVEDDMPWESLANLRDLHLHNLPNMENLPQGIQHLASLQSLHFVECHKLTLLPQAILDLTTLTTLNIKNCQGLKERYQPSNEGDWSKIQHIPHLSIQCKPMYNTFLLLYYSSFIL